MTLLIDAAPLVAFADRRDPARAAVERVLREEPGALVVPCPVTAEVDYLLGRRLGEPSRLAFLEDLVAERFQVACLDAADHALVLDLERRYADLAPGLADLSLVVVAARRRSIRLLTFDERHFRTIRPLGGEPAFALLPADPAA